MAKLDEKLIALIGSKNTSLTLSTVDAKGEVSSTVLPEAGVDEEGRLVLYEQLETSQATRDLTYALWFGKKVALTLLSEIGESFVIKGIPYRDIIVGPAFEEKYRELTAADPESELAGIWIVDPTDIYEDTLTVRRRLEREQFPELGHLDKDFIG